MKIKSIPVKQQVLYYIIYYTLDSLKQKLQEKEFELAKIKKKIMFNKTNECDQENIHKINQI